MRAPSGLRGTAYVCRWRASTLPPVGRTRWWIACVGALGCNPADGDSADRTESTTPRIVTTPAAPMPLPQAEPSVAEPSAAPLARPGPYRGREQRAVVQNLECAGCHVREASQWLGSNHQRSNINAAYRAAFAIEPLPFCRGCHAPEANPEHKPTPEVSALGVGCVTCHVVEEDTVLAAADDAGDWLDDDSIAPHAIRYSTDFAHTGGCASCHEFAFPGPSSEADAHFMQTTVREHQRSRAADEPCAACHMPERGGMPVHGFTEMRNPTWLRAQLDVDARLTERGTVVVSMVQPTPGHAFPSGDLFRRLEVGAELRAANGTVVARDARYLARHLQLLPGHGRRQLVRDNRVFDEPVEVELELKGLLETDPSADVFWWVTYQRVAQTFDGREPTDASIESEVPLHDGTLGKGMRTK